MRRSSSVSSISGSGSAIVIVGATLGILILALVGACASSSSPTSDTAPISPEMKDDDAGGASGSGSSSEGGRQRDGSSTTDDDDSGAPPTAAGCAVKRAANADLCAEDCDARLQLPGGGGGYYCSQQCDKDETCAALGSSVGGISLKCPATIGACVPSCASDASCKALGFLRCDLTTGGCDTIAE